MEFKELGRSSFKQNAILAFNITSSEYNVGLLGSTSEAILLEMKHSALALHTFPYAVETIKLPTTRAAAEIVNKFDMASIYSKENNLKRPYFAIDPLFVGELSEEPIKIQPVFLEWCPKNLYDCNLLAVVTSSGTCELRCRDTISREWKVEVSNLNQLYLDMFPVLEFQKKATFEEFREAVENICITAFSWNKDSANTRPIFVIANATGWIHLFSITKDSSKVVNCLAKCKTTLGRITLIYFLKDLIVACSVDGKIKIFALRGKEIVDVDMLWSKADRMPAKKIIMSFCKKTNKWICVTTKAMHFIAFVLSKEGKLLFKNTKYVGNIKITGLELFSPKEYIVTTICGVIKLIKLNINKNSIDIIEEDVKYDFDYTNYQILGLVASPNKVAWTFALYHNKPYTYPSVYSAHDTFITVCSLNNKDAFEMVMNESREPIENAIDCFEMIRLEILKDNLSPKFENISIQDVKISKYYFKKLQLKLLTMNAERTYKRLKFNHVKKTNANEINSISKLIESIYLNLRLQRLRNLKRHTPFQILAGKCMKYRLKLHQTELIPNEDVFRNIHENLNTLSDCLLMDLDNMFDDATENCSYCCKPIDFSTLMCADAHSIPRCSISYLQVPLFTRVFCSSCNRLFIDDIDNIKSIFGHSEDVKCTYCGIAISTDMAEVFNKIIE